MESFLHKNEVGSIALYDLLIQIADKVNVHQLTPFGRLGKRFIHFRLLDIFRNVYGISLLRILKYKSAAV